ncbi:MAG: TIGR04086 family membrane protein, partial [Oscillospiraceae bacterium]|nr:TIGR04086 family membrane protein [Oscillospiraceae bacterium]
KSAAARKKKSGISRLPACILAATVAGVVFMILFLSIAGAIVAAVSLPLFTLIPISTVAAALAAFAGGCVLGWTYGEKGLLCGACEGLILFLLLILASVFSGTHEFGQLAFLKLAALLCGGTIGGYIGLAQKEKIRRRH